MVELNQFEKEKDLNEQEAKPLMTCAKTEDK